MFLKLYQDIFILNKNFNIISFPKCIYLLKTLIKQGVLYVFFISTPISTPILSFFLLLRFPPVWIHPLHEHTNSSSFQFCYDLGLLAAF